MIDVRETDNFLIGNFPYDICNIIYGYLFENVKVKDVKFDYYYVFKNSEIIKIYKENVLLKINNTFYVFHIDSRQLKYLGDFIVYYDYHCKYQICLSPNVKMFAFVDYDKRIHIYNFDSLTRFNTITFDKKDIGEMICFGISDIEWIDDIILETSYFSFATSETIYWDIKNQKRYDFKNESKNFSPNGQYYTFYDGEDYCLQKYDKKIKLGNSSIDCWSSCSDYLVTRIRTDNTLNIYDISSERNIYVDKIDRSAKNFILHNNFLYFKLRTYRSIWFQYDTINVYCLETKRIKSIKFNNKKVKFFFNSDFSYIIILWAVLELSKLDWNIEYWKTKTFLDKLYNE